MSRRMRLPIAPSAKRIKVGLVVTAMIVSLLAGRALQVQGLDASANAQAAANAMTHKRVLVPQRGAILDRNGVALAESQPAVRVIADPKSIASNGADPTSMSEKQKQKAAEAPAAIAQILAARLGGDAEAYLKQLTNLNRADGSLNQYEIIARQVPAYTYQLIMDDLNAGGWYGIYKEDDPVRYYPGGSLASNVVGFVNQDGKGGGGLESLYEDDLRGVEGLEVYQSSAYGRIPLGDNTMVPAVDGSTYTLTLDSELQWFAQQELEVAIANAGATSGTAVVMGVKTGEVLAMATAPTFDSNAAGAAKDEDRGNRVVTDAYEPGSVQKVLTFAAMLDAGLITPDTEVEIPAYIKSGDGVIRDAWNHDVLHYTARGVLARSSNIGTVELARQLDKATLVDYLTKFGLGAPTGIQQPGEGKGIVPNAGMPDYTRDQIAFGQGISVTAIQEAAALSAAVNGGVYHQPTLLRSIASGTGESIPVTTEEPHRVISAESSTALVGMMEAVMAADSSASTRMIPGYRVAGKSGTAQRVDRRTGTYLGYTSSFVTVAPVEDPQLLVYVVIDNPAPGQHSGSILALPVSRSLMAYALPRYGIVPATEVKPYESPLTYQP